MFFTIYKITNKVNNKIYIGKHKTENLDDCYMGSGLYLNRAINKYGIDKFEKEILYIFETEPEMNQMELQIVNEEFISRPDVYNLKVGGEGGWDHINSLDNSDNVKKGRECTDKILEEKYGTEWRSVIGKKGGKTTFEKHGVIKPINKYAFLGKKHSEETKKKIGESNSKHQMGENNSRYGTMWIYNEKTLESKTIKKTDSIPEGWLKGRKIKIIDNTKI